MVEESTQAVEESAPAVATVSTVGRRKQKIGRVVSDKMEKTVIVSVESLRKHRLYKHTVRVTRRFKVHDEQNKCRTGDTVRIEETRPLSKEKRWRVIEIISHDVRATEAVIPASVLSEQG
jgi:small subunit ribosomal protein S17